MHIVLLAEHAEPLIGGATHLTRKIAETIASSGHQVTFVIPNSGKDVNDLQFINENYSVAKVKAIVAIDDRGKFRREKRKEYAIAVNEFLKAYYQEKPFEIVQILSGLYLMRYLDVPFFSELGVKLVAGLLNVPPEECGMSWEGDSALEFYKDKVRKLVLKEVNKRRIQHHNYHAYTVESEHVKRSLSAYVPQSLITYIPLGTDELVPRLSTKTVGSTLRILTAGGINPSKNQHIIPVVAKALLERGIDFKWDIIGPDRNTRYTNYLKAEIAKLPGKDVINLVLGMPKQELMKYYEQADIYVQTSIEEGFCMTALDALIYGLPLIGFNTGAIAEFISKAKGVLVNNDPKAFADAIEKVAKNRPQFVYDESVIRPVLEYYNWFRIGSAYIQLYEKLLKEQPVIA